MKSSTVDANEFDALMDQVEILQGHFDEVDRKAARLMVDRRRANDKPGHTRIVALRRAMRKDYADTMELIAARITTSTQLRQTRTKILAFKKTAWGFVKDLRKTKMDLDKLTAAAQVLSGLLQNLRAII